MRIGIDARFYGPAGKGIGRYSEKLIAHLEKIDKLNDYFIFLRRENFDLYQPVNPKFHKVLADYPWYSFKEQIFLPFRFREFKLDLAHFLHFNIPLFYFGKFVVTIHDLTLLRFPTHHKNFLVRFLYFFKHFFFILVLCSAVSRAKKIITDSESTKRDLIEYFCLNPKKIKVIYLGSDPIKCCPETA